jgi:hypothetical protein
MGMADTAGPIVGSNPAAFDPKLTLPNHGIREHAAVYNATRLCPAVCPAVM